MTDSTPWGLTPALDSIPFDLRKHDRWVLWKASLRNAARDKWDKTPTNTSGYNLSWSDVGTWKAFDSISVDYALSEGANGVGFVLNGVENLVAIDLDNCFPGRTLAPWAAAIVAKLDTYWELSPSGKGLRGFCHSAIEKSYSKGGVEFYDGSSARFVTVTGRVFHDSDVRTLDPATLDAIIRAHRGDAPPKVVSNLSAPRPTPSVEVAPPECSLPFIDAGDITHHDSRNEALRSDLNQLYRGGYVDADVLRLLEDSEYVGQYALEHRPRATTDATFEAAEQFMWEECIKARDYIKRQAVDVIDSFENLGEPAKVNAKVVPPWRELFQDLTAFAANLEPIRYVVESVIQSGYIYALSGHSNAGKTAIALAIAEAVAAGRPLGKYPTERGTVLFLAGENPQNVQMRGRGMTELGSLTPGVLVMTEVGDLNDYLDRLREMCQWYASPEAQAIGHAPINLIFIDSKLIYFQGESEDDNKQARDQALMFKLISELPGRPAVVVLSHPSKSVATQQGLEPRGGGAFLNQIDGNLTAWSEGDGYTTLWWAKKIRGEAFEPIDFELVQHALEGQTMVLSGNPVTTVVAVVAESGRLQDAEKAANEMADWVLLMLSEDPTLSLRAMCSRLTLGEGAKMRVNRAIKDLVKIGYMKHPKIVRQPYTITRAGKLRALELIDGGVVLPGF